MRVGFRDLTWSSDDSAMAHHHEMAGHYASHLPLLAGPGVLTSVVLVHTVGHLVVAGLVALLFCEKLGLSVLKQAWFNIDFA